MQRVMLRNLGGIRILGWVAGLLLTLALSTSASAVAPQVRDEGKFFGPGAIQKANDQIREIKDQAGKDLVIETYDAPPNGQVVPTDTAGKAAFFENWLNQRAGQLDVDGIIVLITRHPARIQIQAGKNTRQRIFTTSNIQQLDGILTTAFKNKQFDEGLLNGISYVRSTVQANGAGQAAPVRPMNPGPAPAPGYSNNSSRAPVSTGSSHMCLWTFVILIVVFVIIRIFSGLAGRSGGGGMMGGGGGYPGGSGYGGGGYGGGPGYGGGGGGGFMKGMLGGVLGGAAGSWLYDRFNRSDSSSTNYGGGNIGNTGAGYQQPQGYSDTSQQSDQGQGFGNSSGSDFDSSGGSASSSSGSDFDSGSSSSDSGSSFDSGGGGSDFGGGGDSGSGGGDF